jgi:hypothetical protein
VRENTPLLRKNSFAQIVNVSIWETLTRSLNTSMITLFPIATLLVFGGSTLKDFAFALLIGIASGAYSSIFIAAPLLTVWKEREPEYARRIAQPLTDGDGQKMLDLAEKAAAARPAPETPMDVVEDAIDELTGDGDETQDAKRERRRQRRKTRPHGRAR